MKICHVGIMGHIRKEGMIAQYIFDYCEGEHIYYYLSPLATPPPADIYILHCMKNLLYLEAFITFDAPGKIISLVHSSEPCMPAKKSDWIVVLTKYWQKRLEKLYDYDSIVIPGGIDLDVYFPRKKNQKNNRICFGKITRPEPGKFYQEWNSVIKSILEKNKKAECRIICNGYKKINYLKHKKMKWVEGINIKDHEKKIKELNKLDIYIELHNTTGSAFVDTFNFSMLEAMALGIPVLIHRGLQDAMEEVLGYGGVCLQDLDSWKFILNMWLENETERGKYSERARARAEEFPYQKMVERWNEILC